MSQPVFRSSPKVQPNQDNEKCQRTSLFGSQPLEPASPFGEDYRIYQQNVDLDAFFGEEPKYEKVSDVCLLNDHFILVKMPPPDELPPPSKSRIPRCFRCNRGSKVSPIREESEDEKSSSKQSGCLQPWSSSYQDEAKPFNSTTRLTDTPSKKDATPAAVIVEQPHPTLQLEAIQSLAPGKLQLRPTSLGPLHWFLWPFRRRQDSRGNSKSKLAAVHKTYLCAGASHRTHSGTDSEFKGQLRRRSRV
ncbi:uncharacterized protein LOC110185001 [Drosophila serrata]|uniref:uncharacterized protein LOC110185001 n=1 Tax=Drosophila serrata TaxID=7274 RepID=UPI000A1D304B|nr:uncharacterized protein LOC110185001 [Drosophila serrata]